MRDEWSHNFKGNCWQGAGEHKIELGSKVRFTCRAVLEEAEFFSMSGSLKDKGTGNVEVVGRSTIKQSSSKKDKKKSKDQGQAEANCVATPASVKKDKKEAKSEKKDKKKAKKDKSKRKREADDEPAGESFLRLDSCV